MARRLLPCALVSAAVACGGRTPLSLSFSSDLPTEAGVPDDGSAPMDSGQPLPDSSSMDSGPDATTDGATEAAADATTDALPDASAPPTLHCSDAPGLQPGAPWPIAQRCSARGGNTTAIGPTALPTLAWQATEDAGDWGGDIVVAADGTIYAFAGGVVALSPDGGTRWTAPLPEGSNPPGSVQFAIGADGTLYTWSAYGDLDAFQPDGALLWSLPLNTNPDDFGPAVGPDGTLYVAGVDTVGNDDLVGNLTAVSPGGTQRWQTSLGYAEPYSSPAVAPDGTIYMLVATSPGGVLYAFTPGGGVAWTASVTGAAGGPVGTVVVGDDGTVYVTCAAGMCAFHPDGQPAVSFSDTGGAQAVRIVLAPEVGLAYQTDSNLVLTAFTADGGVAWSYVDPNSSQTLVAFADGRSAVYVSTTDLITDWTRVLAADGGVAWAAPDVSPVAMGADGTVYGIADNGKTLVALTP
jgi:hypothetical protein